MANVTAGYVWTSGETVTPTKLNTAATPIVVVADNEVTTAKILDSAVTNNKLASGIADTKLATISTAGKVSNSATTATNDNTANAIVARDASGNFSAGTITASLSGNVTGNLTGTASAIADGSVSTAKIVDANVTNAKLASGIDASKLTTGTLPIARIADGAVSAAKLAAKVTFPNYAAGVGKAYNTVHQAAEDGFLCVTLSGAFRNGIRVLVGTTNTPALEIWLNGDDINSNTKVAGSGMLPIPKDIYYKVEAHPSFDGFETVVINWYPVVT